MKGILIILTIFGLVLLAAVALALIPNLMSSDGTLPDAPQAGVATPTLAAPPPTALPPAAGTLPVVGAGTAGGSEPGGGTVGGGTAGEGLFTGSFAGTLTSDDGSSAPVSLALSQSGTTVSGDITIGDGLTIDGGNCGAQAVPAGSRSISGQVDPSNPNHIEASAGYEVQGFTVTAELIADLSADGRALNGQIGLSLPFLCGRNPVISGSLVRQ